MSTPVADRRRRPAARPRRRRGPRRRDLDRRRTAPAARPGCTTTRRSTPCPGCTRRCTPSSCRRRSPQLLAGLLADVVPALPGADGARRRLRHRRRRDRAAWPGAPAASSASTSSRWSRPPCPRDRPGTYAEVRALDLLDPRPVTGAWLDALAPDVVTVRRRGRVRAPAAGGASRCSPACCRPGGLLAVDRRPRPAERPVADRLRGPAGRPGVRAARPRATVCTASRPTVASCR